MIVGSPLSSSSKTLSGVSATGSSHDGSAVGSFLALAALATGTGVGSAGGNVGSCVASAWADSSPQTSWIGSG